MKRLLFLCSFIFIACNPQEEAQLDYGSSYAYSENMPTRWTRSFPLNLNISNDFDSDEITAISNAAVNWEDSLDNKVNFFNTPSADITEKNSLGSYNDGTFGVYKIYTWPTELPSTALAVTQINGTQFSSYIRIDQADILLNYDYYTYSTDDSWGYDLTTVVLHEMGHFLGLYHDKTDKEASVMYPTIGRFTDNKHPLENDIEKLASKYNVSVARSVAGSNTQTTGGTPISITLELYPDKELIRINGVAHEIHHH